MSNFTRPTETAKLTCNSDKSDFILVSKEFGDIALDFHHGGEFENTIYVTFEDARAFAEYILEITAE